MYLFILERGEGREKERKRERETSTGCLPHTPKQRPNLQPRPVPDQKSNRPPFSSQGDVQPTEPHQPGLFPFLTVTLPTPEQGYLTYLYIFMGIISTQNPFLSILVSLLQKQKN